MDQNRRDFLKTAAVLGAAVTMIDRLGAAESAAAAAGKTEPDLVAVANGEPAALLDAALKEFGGIKTFVKPGQKVVIKPNIAWDRTPESSANTNPQLIAALVRRCLEAGAAKVTVFDHTCDRDWQSCYRKSGIEEAVRTAGGEIVCGNHQSDFKRTAIPRGKVMKEALVHRLVLEADVFINVPVLKNHGGAKLTASLKNLMGIVWDRREMHQKGVQQCIADVASIRPPDLNILDAYRAMQTGGPQGRANSKVLMPKSLLLSRKMVPLDVAGAKMLAIDPAIATHIAEAQALGLGEADLTKLQIRRIKLA